jgi:pimeloyl-ACP methyl ester carboxylesterase
MHFTQRNGLQIYYESHGEGDTIVLLHHGFGCTQMWKEIYPALVREGYRIVMYDRRGYGQSEGGPGFDEFYVSRTFCSDSVEELAALREIIDAEPFHIVGQCEGGVIGAAYAARYPRQVDTLTISSTLCYSRSSMPEFNRSMFPKPFEDLEPDLKETFIGWHGERAETFYNQFRICGGAYGTEFFDIRNVLPSVSCPTLVLYPDRSSLFEVEQGVALFRSLPNGELAVLPKCGHNTYEHQPEEYIRAVLSFLKRHCR